MDSKRLHDQIFQATSKLAKLKARDLIARERNQAREREAARARLAVQRNRFGQLVLDAGGEDLAPGEIVSALLIYREGHRSTEARQQAKTRGDAHLAALESGVEHRRVT